MVMTMWRRIGIAAYKLLLPVIKLYAAHTKPRTRLLIIANNEVLLVKNWLSNDRWALPGGGLESGEEPVHAAIREVYEELGVAIEPEALKELGLHHSTGNDGLQSAFYLYVYETVDRPSVTLRRYEIMDASWWSLSEVTTDINQVSQPAQDAVAVWMKSQNLVS